MLEKWVTGYYKVPVFAPMGHYALFCMGLFYIVTSRIQVNFPGSKASPCVQSKHIQILCLNLKFEFELVSDLTLWVQLGSFHFTAVVPGWE